MTSPPSCTIIFIVFILAYHFTCPKSRLTVSYKVISVPNHRAQRHIQILETPCSYVTDDYSNPMASQITVLYSTHSTISEEDCNLGPDEFYPSVFTTQRIFYEHELANRIWWTIALFSFFWYFFLDRIINWLQAQSRCSRLILFVFRFFMTLIVYDFVMN